MPEQRVCGECAEFAPTCWYGGDTYEGMCVADKREYDILEAPPYARMSPDVACGLEPSHFRERESDGE